MKKILAVFLCLILVLGSTPVVLASVSTVDNVAKNFDFASVVPDWSLGTGGTTAQSASKDGEEDVWRITTGTGDYNMWFQTSSAGFEVKSAFSIYYDVKIESLDSSFVLNEAVINPHFGYTNSSGSSAYIFEQYLPSAYCDSEGNVTFKATAETSIDAGFTNVSQFTGKQNEWYTVKLYVDVTGGILKSYVANRENGLFQMISQKSFSDGLSKVNRLNFTARGSAVYLFDNLKLCTNAVDTASFNVNYFDTLNGLNITVNLPDEVEKAELYANDALIETVENTTYGVYKIANNSVSSTVKKYKLDLVCYDSQNNAVDTVSKTVEPKVLVSSNLKTDASEKSIASNGTNVLEYSQKTASVIEAKYDVQFGSTMKKFEQYTRLYNTSGSSGFGSTIKICQSGVLDLSAFGLPKKAFDSSKWYTIRTIFDSQNSVVTAYINDGNGEQFLYNGTLNSANYGIGYYNMQLVADGTGATIKNGYVNDILTLSATSADTYINYLGTAMSIDGTVPASARSVNITLGDLVLSSLDGVKLYKDGVEVTGINKNVSGNVLTVAPATFEAGNYKVEISGTTYGGNATNLVFEEEFKVVNEFAVLSPENGEKLSADKLSIAVSTLNCEKLEIYANDVMKSTVENPEAIYVYEYTPESFGTLKIDAVATMSDGSKETDTVFAEIEGTVLTYEATRTFGYTGSKFTLSDTNVNYNDTAARYYTVSDTAALGTNDSGYFSVSTTSETSSAASLTNGIVHLKHYIKFDDASAHLLKSEGQSYNSDNTKVFAPYPMNSSNSSRDIFRYGTITKEPSVLGTYSYSDGKWYEIEYVIDMKGKQQWTYIKDMETGAVETLADGITADIADGYGFYQLKYEMNKGATTGTVGITLSSVDVKNYEKIPTMGNITYSGTTSTNGMIEPCSSIEIALDGTGFDGDISQYITLTKNGETANAEISYADGKITVTPEGGFQKNNRYKVTILGDATVKSKKINIPVSKEITVAEGGLYISPLKIVKGDTAGTYKAELNYYNYGETTEDGILVLASYSGNKMNKIALSLKNKFTKGYGMLNAEISSVTSGETVKAMLWNNTSVLSPMIGSLDITAE